MDRKKRKKDTGLGGRVQGGARTPCAADWQMDSRRAAGHQSGRPRNLGRRAEELYYREPAAVPVKVEASFWRVERSKNTSRQVRQMAEGLTAFVRAHAHEADPVENFSWRPELPAGFGVIQIAARPGAWGTWGYSTNTLDGIKAQLAARISERDELLPGYRANLPGSPIWLLIYSTWDVTRGVPTPHGIGDWSFASSFDRMFFYSAMSESVEEIRRG